MSFFLKKIYGRIVAIERRRRKMNGTYVCGVIISEVLCTMAQAKLRARELLTNGSLIAVRLARNLSTKSCHLFVLSKNQQRRKGVKYITETRYFLPWLKVKPGFIQFNKISDTAETEAMSVSWIRRNIKLMCIF